MTEQEFLENYDPSKYPIITLTVDILVYHECKVLLVKRRNYPFKGKWALPGGFIDEGERAEQAAMRELREETGIYGPELTFADVLDDPNRDPRGRVISLVYLCKPGFKIKPMPGDDAADADWFSVYDLPDMAFDHEEVIARKLRMLEW